MIDPASPLPLLDSSRIARRVADRFRESGRRGSRVPLATRVEIVEDRGLRFVVRVRLSAPRRAAPAAPPAAGGGRGPSPFLPPYDPSLLVGSLSPSHVCLLNKYNAIERHLLIVTREYADQEGALDADDFAATAICLDGLAGLAFFNGGAIAGASQAHKHLQVVPFPLAPGEPTFPLAPSLEAAIDAGRDRSDQLPFPHRMATVTGAGVVAAYRALIESLGLARDGGRLAPYNLLWTREWMLAVPRARAAFETIEVNALGFAGALLVSGEGALERVREIGPLEILRRVASDPEGERGGVLP